jgi:hypothetical protein
MLIPKLCTDMSCIGQQAELLSLQTAHRSALAKQNAHAAAAKQVAGKQPHGNTVDVTRLNSSFINNNCECGPAV